MMDKLKWIGAFFSILPHYSWYSKAAFLTWFFLTCYVIYLFTAGRPFVPTLPRMSSEELYSQTIDLSRQILDFITDRQRNEPQIDFDNWKESTSRQISYSSETYNIFLSRFSGKALALRDEFYRHSLSDEELNKFIDHPTNVIGMRTVGIRLASLAHSLPREKNK